MALEILKTICISRITHTKLECRNISSESMYFHTENTEKANLNYPIKWNKK